MSPSTDVDTLIQLVTGMNRESIVEKIEHFQGPFPVDFTPQFLDSLDLDRLRHVFFALCLQAQRTPSQAA